MIFAYLQKHNLNRHTSSSTCPATYPRTNYQHPCETHLIIDLYVVIMILLRKPLDSYASLDQLWPLILCRDVIKPRINTYKPFFALKYIKYHHYGHLLSLSLSPIYIAKYINLCLVLVSALSYSHRAATCRPSILYTYCTKSMESWQYHCPCCTR